MNNAGQKIVVAGTGRPDGGECVVWNKLRRSGKKHLCVHNISYAPLGLESFYADYPRFAPWATIYRRSAANHRIFQMKVTLNWLKQYADFDWSPK